MPRLVRYTDPRRPDDATPYKHPSVAQDESEFSEVLVMGSFGLSILAVFTSNRFTAVTAVIAALFGVINARSKGSNEGQSNMTAILMALVGVNMTYMQHLIKLTADR
ncbi:hypothetical protein HK097_000911 [Rhizophlyctis rosea]|uniref:Uncharacterized protein n=1 Tax=Rhizophlyctis rosea TaxID=64517 RepID=A0AAD5SD03_9FUNG|nr:hypothetical protein HK097_000911 [Rhizophlyctis rosea]